MHKIPLALQPTENDMNHDTIRPPAATRPQPGRTADVLSQHDEPGLDPRELTPCELQAVAGGPTIQNGTD